MQKRSLKLLVVLIPLTFCNIFSQEDANLGVAQIDSILIRGANAVVRSEEIIVEINSIRSITTKTKRIITVLNKFGDGYADSYEGYDPSIHIKKLGAIVYDASGKEIKRYKKKDFKDRSAFDGISLMNDNRIKYIDYTAISYPYTLAWESEVESSTTAFIPSWVPVRASKLGIQKSSYKVLNTTSIPIRIKESNFEGYSIIKNKTDHEISFLILNVLPRQPEVLSPSYLDMVPEAKVTLNDFFLEGVKGSASDWKSFGKWQYDKLLSGRNELPLETIEEINTLVTNAKTDKEKVKLIYEYVQDKTRYISVQLGIGGWMPFLASDVDRLGYGDCKALTNYTRALLDSQKITSYYTIVYAQEKRDIDSDFVSMQGNHVILNVPYQDEEIWLECTSQTMPFNFIGDFTDDRNVLVVKPEGGEIKRTKKYKPQENILNTVATIKLNTDKSMVATLKRESKGLEYNGNYDIQYQEPKDQKLHYKKKWGYVNNLEINSVEFKNNRDTVLFTEDIEVSCTSYTKKVGDRFLLMPNMFSCDQSSFPKYKNRVTPLVISRGYVHTDEYIINLPEDYTVRNLPEKKTLETEFGKYIYELEKLDESQIRFKRFLKIVDGIFPKEKYEKYREFRSRIKKIDKSRIVLKQQ
ncbi:DUF3857 domain-containing protein [Aquimarina sp. U1-2]|uniref:DUF3857 domain-containing protein n=1 Tax=Aquimarina sp. U1-2 TaxID=2823141 RepID=UPI001AECC61A|nr:DUF3857 domain-containing protein [Aquimarina sp. U1-2]MBP2833725.1 DUF3857 domain-containing protein [Aquimarina sp. U1-2]